jgi:hypothetical protein
MSSYSNNKQKIDIGNNIYFSRYKLYQNLYQNGRTMSISIYGKINTHFGLVTREGPNFANGNFEVILSMINYKIKDLEQLIDGGELEILKNKLTALLQVVRHIPSEFETKTTIDKKPGCTTIIEQGKDALYYEIRVQEILDFIKDAQQIYFA